MSVSAREEDGKPVIIGSGLAGLVAALTLAPRPVVVLSKSPLGAESSSVWAQGGLAAAIGPDDSPALHAADTIAAGDGLNDAETTRRITDAGPDTVAFLERLGVEFARDATGAFVGKLEAAHSRRRVLNAHGDGTGAEIMRGVLAAVRRTPSITVMEGVSATALTTDDQGITGVAAFGGGDPFYLATRLVIMATGGCGGLWQRTTNPAGSVGEGLAMAARAGADLVDLEFMQFHPTAIEVGRDPMPLASEALRGDGGLLINDRGDRFMAAYARGELEPRDIVARAVWAEIAADRRTFLDTRASLGVDLARRFPGIAAVCAAAGIDPVREPIPIAPAAHYHMGGIAVGPAGRSTVDGLWACGEVASTGLHGANRLASNSLLEAVVTARLAAADIDGFRPVGTRLANFLHDSVTAASDPAERRHIRELMTTAVGVLRDAIGLSAALTVLLPIAIGPGPNALAATAALLITAAAIDRRESRGGHYRTDYPTTDPRQRYRRHLSLAAGLELARTYALESA